MYVWICMCLVHINERKHLPYPNICMFRQELSGEAQEAKEALAVQLVVVLVGRSLKVTKKRCRSVASFSFWKEISRCFLPGPGWLIAFVACLDVKQIVKITAPKGVIETSGKTKSKNRNVLHLD